MEILNKLLETPLKLSHLSAELSLPVQEISRQLSRLDKNDLVQKNLDGSYSVTSFAEQVLRLIPGMKYFSDNRGYFKTHSMSGIPDRFLMQVGNLTLSKYVEDVMTQLHHSEKIIREAEEYLWIISDQVLMSSLQFTEAAIERNVEHRFLGPRDIKPPAGFYEEATKRGLIGAQGKAKYRFLDELHVLIMLTEKEATFSFPNNDGKFEYSGFQTMDAEALEWCKRIFQYYWDSTGITVPDAVRFP